MRIHLGRAALVTIALAELGAVVGTGACWLFLTGWALSRYGPLPSNAMLGALVWAGMVGAPAGAVALPLLGLTFLRKQPLSRALGFPVLGALLGLTAAVMFVRGPALWPVPWLVPALGFGGVFAGAAAASVERLRFPKREPRQLVS